MGATFCEIEVDPLLAFQMTIDLERSQHHCSHLKGSATPAQLYDICLPITTTVDQLHVSLQSESALIRCRNLNFRLQARGPLQGVANAVGIQVGWAMPLVHVVRYNGRCYLHNGFHRTYGARLAGATSVPCIFRDVRTAEEIGFNPQTLSLQLLESSNPPTLGHFTQRRAWPVDLRVATRIIQVSWSEHIMFEE
jgi:hypothetical protein